jgi:endonuclease III
MTTSSPLKRGAVERLVRIDHVLAESYGTPERDLDNKDDPLDEAIYIILSLQTDLTRLRGTWSRLRRYYPTWAALLRTPTSSVAATLREGGLHWQKARTIRRLLAEVQHLAGSLSLDLLRSMDDECAERLLTHLPGLSWKAARCVLLYSLGRDMFPVDSNTFRILKRAGVLRASAVYRRRRLHDELQNAVVPVRRRAFHVNLVIHGQRVCLPRIPNCSGCPILPMCPRVGMEAGSPAPTSRPESVNAREKCRRPDNGERRQARGA